MATKQLTIINRTLATYHSNEFRYTEGITGMGAEQACDWAIACDGWKRSRAQWLWQYAYTIERTARSHSVEQAEINAGWDATP